LKTTAKLNVLINFAAILKNCRKMLKKSPLKVYFAAVYKPSQNFIFCGGLKIAAKKSLEKINFFVVF